MREQDVAKRGKLGGINAFNSQGSLGLTKNNVNQSENIKMKHVLSVLAVFRSYFSRQSRTRMPRLFTYTLVGW